MRNEGRRSQRLEKCDGVEVMSREERTLLCILGAWRTYAPHLCSNDRGGRVASLNLLPRPSSLEAGVRFSPGTTRA